MWSHVFVVIAFFILLKLPFATLLFYHFQPIASRSRIHLLHSHRRRHHTISPQNTVSMHTRTYNRKLCDYITSKIKMSSDVSDIDIPVCKSFPCYFRFSFYPDFLHLLYSINPMDSYYKYKYYVRREKRTIRTNWKGNEKNCI